MSTTKIVTVHCDRCGVWTDGGTASCTTRQVRVAARQVGWRRVQGDDYWDDLCPNCFHNVRAAVADAAEGGRPMSEPPVTNDFLADVAAEFDFQTERWGADHDDAKSDDEWFWTLGYLVGKVLRPDASIAKKRHRLRAAAALLMQWDQRLAKADEAEGADT